MIVEVMVVDVACCLVVKKKHTRGEEVQLIHTEKKLTHKDQYLNDGSAIARHGVVEQHL